MSLPCDHADLLLAAAALGPLDDEDVRTLERHLEGCASCRGLASEYRQAAALLPLAVDPVDPPPALRSRLMAQVHSEAAGTARAAPQPAHPRIRRLWSGIPAGRRFTVAGALTTALAVTAAIVAVATRPAATGPGTAAPVSVRACGLTAAPSACATLTYHPGSQDAVLSVRGLPPLAVTGTPAGTYEVWLVRANHSTVPAAYLTLAPDGSTFTAAVQGDMSQYVAVATTREPPGGSRVPTGTEVLRLELPAPSQPAGG